MNKQNKNKVDTINKQIKDLKQQIKGLQNELATIQGNHEVEIDEILTAIENALNEDII